MRPVLMSLMAAALGLVISSRAQAAPPPRVLPSYRPGMAPMVAPPYARPVQMPIVVAPPVGYYTPAVRPPVYPYPYPPRPVPYPAMPVAGAYPGYGPPGLLNAYGNTLAALGNAGPVGAMASMPLVAAAPAVIIAGIFDAIFGR